MTMLRIRRAVASAPSRALASVLAVACTAAPLSFGIGVASAHEPDAEEVALGSLVDAELAFARTSREQGVRAASLANFAADGIVFECAPVRPREAWSAPSATDPKASPRSWQPAQAGVARSYDMGYTTGTFAADDSAHAGAIRRGVFFSVWQRQANNPWQVVLAVNTATPDAVDFVTFGEAPRPHYTGPPETKTQRQRLLQREAHPVATVRGKPSAAAYAALLSPQARLYREGMAPLAGRTEVAQRLGAASSRITWPPIDVRISRAGDMAVSYGKFREIESATAMRSGYYVHLWLRDAAGQWRLAYDIATANS